MRSRELSAALLALWLCGCAQVDVVAKPQATTMQPSDARVADARMPDAGRPDTGAHDARVPPLDAEAIPDAGERDAGPTPTPCRYRMPPGATPAAQPARALASLTHAVCSCDSIASSDRFSTDAAGALHGDVGVNGVMSVETTSEVGGSLVVGSGGLHLGDDVELGVGVDLRVAGPLEGTLATLRVERNASVGGRIDLTSLYVAGTLTQTAGAERRITGTSQLGGDVDGEVTVPAPCDCADASLFDTAAFVADNASSALALPNADGGVQTPRCASFALPDGEVDDVHITLSEPAAIYVPGDLHTTGDLAIDSAAGAEIDLFIAGDVRIDGALHVGAASGQGPVRIYVGGGGTIQLSGGGELHGMLYAPKAELVLSAPLTLRGALFVRRVAASAELSVK
jgi:hypothetical protein